MSKSHVVALAVLIAAATAIGTYAATRTTELGVQARAASSNGVDRVVTVRTRRLDSLEAQLRKTLAKKPPALPALPKAQTQPRQATRFVSSPPAAVTVTRVASAAPATSHGEHEHGQEDSGGERDD
jgi:hypothetical protein